MELHDKTFIVTGGGSGLGAAVAREFVAAGAAVVLADVDVEGGTALASELGARACFSRCDVCNSDDVAAAIDHAHAEYGSLHGAVNCAGVATIMKTVGRDTVHDLAVFDQVLQINVVGTFNVIRLVAAAMQANPIEKSAERGIFINTASIAAFDGQMGQAAYAASKGAVVAMTLPIARDLAREGIRVVTIAPGPFKTPMMAQLPQEVQDSVGSQVPFPSRLGNPDEFARLARHIVENQMINGECIRIDGAIRMGPK